MPVSYCFFLFSTEDSIVDNWNERFPLPDNDFEFLEPVLALRASMLQTLVTLRRIKSHSPKKLAQAYKDLAIHLEMQAKKARWSHNPQVRSDAMRRSDCTAVVRNFFYNVCLISISDTLLIKLQKYCLLILKKYSMINCAKESEADVLNTFCATWV